MRIGTWNLENLFRPNDGVGPTSQEAYDAKLTVLANGIEAMLPDVLAVQEVGEDQALDDLRAKLGGAWHMATASPDGRGIRVGVLSRTPIIEEQEIRAFPAGLLPIQVDDTNTPMNAMGRAALHVRTEIDGHTIDIVSCHLKSKLLTFPGGFSPHDEDERARFAAYALFRRAAEATTIRAASTALLQDRGAERALVVLGDMNDEAEAATTQILQGPPGSEIGTLGFSRKDDGDGQRLWNLAARIPEKQRYSRRYRGRDELIDHIFVSKALVDHVVDGGVTTDAAEVIGPTPSVNDDPQERRNSPGSDHRPVLAVIHV
jgi:endonuclease/exonuclease/phosphatase family metal-dependent hydrolase